MLDFYPRVTKDGSISLFNQTLNDIYHSSIGAFTESIMKFIIPSGILNSLVNNISLLDICYGLGYNTKALLTEIYDKGINKKVFIDAIEIDKNVIALSLIMKDEKTPYFIQQRLIDLLFSKDLIGNINLILKNKKFRGYIAFKNVFYIKKQLKTGLKYTRKPSKVLSLHNIYYKYISSKNINELKSTKNTDFFDIKLHVDDGRCVLTKLNRKYDYVFHDGFDPKKHALLWTEEFFKLLYILMLSTSNLTTYTSSAIVRSGLLQAGFKLGVNRYNQKSVGTIAYKGEGDFDKLTTYEEGLLATKAGITYKDNQEMTLDNSDIINNRLFEAEKSMRISSSKYIKASKHV